MNKEILQKNVEKAFNFTLKSIQNAVMNYTEYEIKVRDATNNDPWGTSATTMMDIANATHNYTHFQDIVNTLYKRLQEPVGPDWRHNYKALQLLEFLIINGSPQIIDNAKRHIYEVKAMESYHYIDEKVILVDKVRHRASKVLELLASDDLIRQARQKAKETRDKYTGLSSHEVRSGGFGVSSTSSSGGRYGGFGSDSVRSGGFNDRAGGFQDSYEPKPTTTSPPVQPPAPKPIEANLLDFDPVDTSAADDFGDFTGAPPANSSNQFSSFQSTPAVPVSTQNQFTTFQSSTSPVNTSNQFTALQSTPMNVTSTFPSNNTQNTAGMNQSFPAFGSFAAPQTYNQPSLLNQQPMANNQFGSFGDFASAPATTAKADDPIAKLVSLDPLSLGGLGKKENTGKTLNQLSNQNQFKFQ